MAALLLFVVACGDTTPADTAQERVVIGPDEDLAATIAGLAPGVIVVLQDATYELRDTLVITADREIRGSGGTVLRTAALAPSASTLASEVPEGFGQPVVYAEGITLVLRDVTVRSNEATGIGIANASTVLLESATLTDTAVGRNTWVGAHAVGAGSLTLRSATFTDNADHGVFVLADATLVIEGGRYAGATRAPSSRA